MILLNGKEVEFKKFPNGETLFIPEGLDDLWHNQISFKYEDDSDLIKLFMLRHYLDERRFTNIKLLIYYMPYSRMDRSVGGSPFTLGYIADFINNLEFDSVEIIEPHSDVTPAVLFRSKTNYINEELLTIVMNEVQFDLATDYVVYPDGGAQKRYAKMFDGNTLVGHKERDFTTGKIKKLDIIGNIPSTLPLQNAKALIVDDLSSYGGTFLLTAEKLREKGFKEVYLLVAHCEESIYLGDVLKTDLIDKVYTTNTIINFPKEEELHKLAHGDKIKIYNIEELLNN